MRLCGICEEKAHKEKCWRSAEQSERMRRAIQKKLNAKRIKREKEKAGY
ncbi:hypothetical protein [Solibacillus sp. FSL W8-0372]